MEKLWRTKEEYRELVKEAKEADLLAYLLTYEPGSIRREGGVYKHSVHDSLVYMNRGGYWYWYSRGKVVNALDYLTDPELGGYSFADAVAMLTRGLARSDGYREQLKKVKENPLPEREFKLPYPRRYAALLTDYLRGRGIHPKVISRCQKLGLVYESMHYGSREAYERKEGVLCAVFVGYEGSSDKKVARFAQKRSMEGAEPIKRDVAGSDKRFSFCYPPKEAGAKELAVFEAPIDALSHASLQEMEGWKWNGWRLSLSGTSPVALMAFLERHPEIRRVSLYLDNDAPGIQGARRIASLIEGSGQFPKVKARIRRIHGGGKDYNENLKLRLGRQRQEAAAEQFMEEVKGPELKMQPEEARPILRKGVLKRKGQER